MDTFQSAKSLMPIFKFLCKERKSELSRSSMYQTYKYLYKIGAAKKEKGRYSLGGATTNFTKICFQFWAKYIPLYGHTNSDILKNAYHFVRCFAIEKTANVFFEIAKGEKSESDLVGAGFSRKVVRDSLERLSHVHLIERGGEFLNNKWVKKQTWELAGDGIDSQKRVKSIVDIYSSFRCR